MSLPNYCWSSFILQSHDLKILNQKPKLCNNIFGMHSLIICDLNLIDLLLIILGTVQIKNNLAKTCRLHIH